MNSISPNLNLMIKACEKASKIIIRDFGEIENLQVSKKGPRDFVTKTDKRVERILIDELSKSRKGYSFITEETGIIEGKNNNHTWIIDPIDGTTNFLHGIPHCAISIALKIKDKIEVGIVYDPLKNDIFYAQRNNGAYLNNKRIKVSNRSKIDDCLFATNLVGAKYSDFNIRYTGSAALDLSYVACGRFDGYFIDKINIWDVAAGLLILEEAGGKMNDINIKVKRNLKIMVANQAIFPDMRNKLRNF